MRDAFAVLFFVSVGMLLDPAALLDSPGLLIASLAVVLVGKPLAALLIVRLLRYPFRVALSLAGAPAPIREFSFMLSSLGRDLGVLSNEASNTLVAVSIISIVLNPVLYRTIAPVEAWTSRQPWLWRVMNPAERPAGDLTRVPHVSSSHRAVVVG